MKLTTFHVLIVASLLSDMFSLRVNNCLRSLVRRSSSSIMTTKSAATSTAGVVSHRHISSTPLDGEQRIRPKVLFVLGGPGAGKGTQCIKLSNEYGMQHLSAGELLREEIASGSSTGQMIASIINEGKIVPVQISLDLIRNKIESIPCNRFLVDGFPRNWDNVQGWDSCMDEVCDVEGVMFIDCPEAELEKRLLSRGQTSGRSDDNVATARKRFATFKEATMPIVDHFESQNKLMRVAGNQPVDAVFHDLQRHVIPFIEKEIVDLTGVLLDAIAAKDWDTYAAMVDPSLTCFEKEGRGNLVEGLEFHKCYFDHDSSSSSNSNSNSGNNGNSNSSSNSKTVASASASTQLKASQPAVRSMGKSAVINFVRTMPNGEKFEESRIWQLSSGAWRLVHFHRGPAPSS